MEDQTDGSRMNLMERRKTNASFTSDKSNTTGNPEDSSLWVCYKLLFAFNFFWLSLQLCCWVVFSIQLACSEENWILILALSQQTVWPQANNCWPVPTDCGSIHDEVTLQYCRSSTHSVKNTLQILHLNLFSGYQTAALFSLRKQQQQWAQATTLQEDNQPTLFTELSLMSAR